MPFKDLTLAPTDQALLDRFAAVVRLPDYRPIPGGPTAPDQVFDNIDRDPQIPDEEGAGRPASGADPADRPPSLPLFFLRAQCS